MTNIVDQREDGKWEATCPYDSKKFVGESKEDALTKEGIYRAEHHIEADSNIAQKSYSEDKKKNIVKDWEQDQQRVTS